MVIGFLDLESKFGKEGEGTSAKIFWSRTSF
jgi:hypothetical protein